MSADGSRRSMRSAQRPPDEDARLKTLRSCDVLDSEPEAVYDDITRLLAWTCDVPMAVISLVDDDRQWFKSSIGIDCSEAPRDVGFCAHAIVDRDALLRDAESISTRVIATSVVDGDPSESYDLHELRARIVRALPALESRFGACAHTLRLLHSLRPRRAPHAFVTVEQAR